MEKTVFRHVDDIDNLYHFNIKNSINEKGIKEEYQKRDKLYTEFTQLYKEHLNMSFKFKKWARILSFTLLSLILGISFTFCIITTILVLNKDTLTIEGVSILLPMYASFLASVMKIPDKILEFVYYKEEESYMVKILEDMQIHDRNI